MLNSKPCHECQHYDPIMRGNNRGLKETKWAWCAKHSVYPMTEGPGQKFPAGVQRMTDPDKPAKPKIVQRGQVVSGCGHFQPRKAVLSKADLLQKVKAQQGGKIS